MTPANLPDLYARVVAKRPELAVEGLTYESCFCGKCGLRWHLREDWCLSYPKDHRVSEMILARWVEALPIHAGVVRGMDQDNHSRWYVDGPRHIYDCCDTPLEALAAFWESTA